MREPSFHDATDLFITKYFFDRLFGGCDSPSSIVLILDKTILVFMKAYFATEGDCAGSFVQQHVADGVLYSKSPWTSPHRALERMPPSRPLHLNGSFTGAS
jgi:hypothetical protein